MADRRDATRLTLVSMAMGAVAACVDTVPDFGLDLIPPRVASVEPADDAEGVDLVAEVRVTMSERLDPQSVGNDAIALSVAATGDAVEGSLVLGIDGSSLVFTPSMRLAYFREYQVHVDASLEDVVGYAVEGPLASSFSTRDLRWETPVLLWANEEEVSDPIIEVAPSGRGVAAWTALMSNPERTDLLASEVNPATGWSEPFVVNGPGSAVGKPEVVVSDSGAAFVAWRQTGSTAEVDLWVRVRNEAGIWADPEQVDLLTGDVRGFSLIASGDGARIAWSHNTGAMNEIFSRAISSTGTIGTRESVSPSGSINDSDQVRIAVSKDGAALCLFSSFDGTYRNLHASRMTPAGVWLPSELVENSDLGVLSITALDVAEDEGGALAAWRAGPAGSGQLWASRFTPSGGWEAPERLDDPTASTPVNFGDLVLLADGTGLAVWSEHAATSDDITWRRWLPSTGSWEGPQAIPGYDGNIGGLDLDGDGRGNALLLVKAGPVGAAVLRSTRYLDGDWEPPIPIADDLAVASVALGDAAGIGVWSALPSTGGGLVWTGSFK